jgi:diguanylate cyclase (GGDEF)-like protein
MSADTQMTPRRAGRVRSLRSRWNWAFAVLTAIVVLSGLVSSIGTHWLVAIFQDSAVTVERSATISAKLRAEIIAGSVVISSSTTPTQLARAGAADIRIRADFARAIAGEDTPGARSGLRRSLHQWQIVVDAAGPPSHPALLEVRAAAVTLHTPQALTLLDNAGTTSRQDVRKDLAKAARINHVTITILILFELLALGLAVRLARRLSLRVLQPLGELRDSANHLASGQLDHRVVIERNDEFGQLGASFNAMADAIAGSQRSLKREASTDSLSGLANRAAFRDRLNSTLSRRDRRVGQQAVLFVDLDDFKDVNDTLGHAAGDELLRTVAERLIQTLRPGDMVARLGGDEFALLLEGLDDPGTALTVAERVVSSLAKPFDLGEHVAEVGASVGLAMRHRTSDAEGLMREADVAMYAAKAKGKNRVELYDSGLDDQTVARHALKTEVVRAAERGELVVEYQPMVDLQTGALVGVEALVRWQHPTRGLLPPSEFIGLAEDTGAIASIGRFVLETASRQLRSWQRRYDRPDLWLSVNVSVRELDGPAFAGDVLEILRVARLDPSSVVVEITETILAEPQGGTAATLVALRRAGARVALDDFGTGYSSIGYLRELPVDILKIDRSFLAGFHAGGPDSALLEGIMAMAERLGLDVIPEGIEEPDQLARLRALGCRVGQGFLLARPLSSDAIDALLAAPMPLPHIGLGEGVGLHTPPTRRA